MSYKLLGFLKYILLISFNLFCAEPFAPEANPLAAKFTVDLTQTKMSEKDESLFGKHFNYLDHVKSLKESTNYSSNGLMAARGYLEEESEQFDEYFDDQIEDKSEEENPEQYDEYLDEENSEDESEDNPELVGPKKLVSIAIFHKSGDGMEIDEICVHDSYQRKGYGTRIIEALKQIYNPAFIKVIPIPHEPEVEKFYSQLGFRYLSKPNPRQPDYMIRKCAPKRKADQIEQEWVDQAE